MPVIRTRACRLAACVSLLLSPACGGGGSSSGPLGPTAPTEGAWTGTITRPEGRGTLSVRWEATTSGSDLRGPLTMTNGAASVTVTARGSTGGNDRQGYAIWVSFNQENNELPTTGCAVRAATVTMPGGEPFPAPYNRFTIRGLDITYSGCRGGLISTGYSGDSNFLRETVRLEMSK